jgi:hypothetical protein
VEEYDETDNELFNFKILIGRVSAGLSVEEGQRSAQTTVECGGLAGLLDRKKFASNFGLAD